jgi:hypothetical protein
LFVGIPAAVIFVIFNIILAGPTTPDPAEDAQAKLRELSVDCRVTLEEKVPGAHIVFGSSSYSYIEDGNALIVFDYSLTNAYGAKAIHHAQFVVNPRSRVIISADDKFSHFEQ